MVYHQFERQQLCRRKPQPHIIGRDSGSNIADWSQSVPQPRVVTEDFDMQALFENGWPSDRPARKVGAPAPGEWHHSDFLQVGYIYTYALFNKMVTSGNLK